MIRAGPGFPSAGTGALEDVAAAAGPPERRVIDHDVDGPGQHDRGDLDVSGQVKSLAFGQVGQVEPDQLGVVSGCEQRPHSGRSSLIWVTSWVGLTYRSATTSSTSIDSM